jgi:hypothetical protein
MKDNILEAYEEMLNEVGKVKAAKDIYKIGDMKNLKKPTYKKAQEGKRLAKEMSLWFESMMRNMDELELEYIKKIENAYMNIKKTANSLGIG